MLLDDGGVGRVDGGVRVHIGTEVGSINRLTQAALRLRHVRGVDGAVGVGVADQDAHRDVEVVRAIHPVDPHIDVLRVGYVGERDGNGVAADGDVTGAYASAADAPRAHGQLRLRT